MKVCNRCGDQATCVRVEVRIYNFFTKGYEFKQDFDICPKCKTILLNQLSIVISNCKINHPKEKPKVVAKKKSKPKKNNK